MKQLQWFPTFQLKIISLKKLFSGILNQCWIYQADINFMRFLFKFLLFPDSQTREMLPEKTECLISHLRERNKALSVEDIQCMVGDKEVSLIRIMENKAEQITKKKLRHTKSQQFDIFFITYFSWIQNMQEKQHIIQKIKFVKKGSMQPQSKAKKQVIIVTGKMGVGKSSFIKSLVPETEGQDIQIGDDIKSVTNTCKLFELDKNMLSFDTSNCIYLMDTPGLESLSDSHKIVLQIEKLVLAEKLQIIGVAFLFPITNGQRLVDQENRSPIQQFFNLLTLRKSKKEKLFFPIITQYDLVYDEQIQKKYLQLQNYFQQIKLNEMWEKKILWVSQCATTKTKFEKACRDSFELRQIVTSRVKRLSQILKENMKLTLTYEEYLEDYNSYLQTVRSMIGKKKNLRNPEIAFSTIQNIEIQMEFQKKNQENWWLKWSSKLTGAAGLVSSIYRGWKFYGIIMAGLTGGISSVGLPIFYFVGSSAVASVIFLNLGVKNSVEKTEQSSIKKKQLKQEIEQFNLKMILSEFTDQVKIQDNSIEISCENIVKKVNKVTEVNTSRDLLISEKDTKKRINLEFGEEQNYKKVIFNFDAWGLRSDELRNILVVATQKYYDHL